MNKAAYTVLKVEKVITETEDFKTFVFAHGHNIIYQAGQFLTLIHHVSGVEIRRSYSIVSSPASGEALSIGVKRIANGAFSRMLVDLISPGDQIETTGASGFFRLPENIAEINKVFFFAAGSGITPVLSLIKTLLFSYPKMGVVLTYSNHSQSTTAYYEALLLLQKDFYTQLVIYFLFSDSPDLLRARLNRDLFFDLLKQENGGTGKNLFYLCGPPAYMRMIIYLLEEYGVPDERVRKEDFVPIMETVNRNLPPSRESWMATVHMDKETYRFPVHYPDSILRAAIKLGISLPYSCENGRCGNCAAYCIHGEVWHSNNEVLTAADMQKGLILTCVGHPLHADVELEIK